MDYLKVYNSIINKGKSNIFEKDDYFEEHHIVPKCLGGQDSNDNLVKLTYREHFVAHWLLFRIYPSNKMISAAFHIIAFGTNCRNTRKHHKGYMPSSRAIDEAKMAKVLHRTGSKHSPETIIKMRESWEQRIKNGYVSHNKGKVTSDETKEKQRQSKLGKKRPHDVIEKIRNTKLEQSKETRELKIKLRQDKAKFKKEESERKYQEKKLNDIIKYQLRRNKIKPTII